MMVRITAALVLLAVVIAWLMLAVLDVEANDGAAGLVALFVLPMIVSAIVIDLVLRPTVMKKERPPRSVLWWMLAVLPLGVSGAFIVGAVREPEYFLSDGPWMMIWIPIFAYVALGLGFLVWFFFVFPLFGLIRNIVAYARGEVERVGWVGPLVMIAVGAVCVVGGLSMDTDGVGRAAWGSVIAAFFGLPGSYEIVWEPGLWIARVLVVAIVLAFAIPASMRRGEPERTAD